MPTIMVNNENFDVTLGTDFRLAVQVNGETLRADNIDALRAIISRKVRSAKQAFNIPVVMRHNHGFGSAGKYVRAILRGQNTRTRHALMTIDGKAEQIERPMIIARGAAVTDEQLAELNRLLMAAHEANSAHGRYVDSLKDGPLHVEALLKIEAEKEPA